MKNDKISYLAVPLGYRMWQKKESKLELAASMVRQVMPEFSQQKNVIILCDSWYMKQNLVSIIEEYENLDLMVRSCKGIEMMINLINVAYCAMKLLPYQDESFSDFRDKSVQDFRFALSEGIRQQVFFATLVQNIETPIKSSSIINALKQAIVKQEHYL